MSVNEKLVSNLKLYKDPALNNILVPINVPESIEYEVRFEKDKDIFRNIHEHILATTRERIEAMRNEDAKEKKEI